MKVINASYEILEGKLEALSMYERLEYCGRICYKSEDKITNDSAIPFCKKMLSNGHMSTMEMGQFHFLTNGVVVDKIKASGDKYFIISQIMDDRFIVSGSPRAILECPGAIDLRSFLNHRYSVLFPEETIPTDSAYVCFASMYNLPYEHQHIAVKFIVNRAVTHEIVRHRPVTYLQESQRYCRYSADKFGNEVTFIAPTVFFGSGVSDEYVIWEKAMEFAEQQYFELLKTSSPQAARTVLPNSCKTEIIVYTNTIEWEHILKLRTSNAAEPSMREVMIPLQKELIENGYIKNPEGEINI